MCIHVPTCACLLTSSSSSLPPIWQRPSPSNPNYVCPITFPSLAPSHHAVALPSRMLKEPKKRYTISPDPKPPTRHHTPDFGAVRLTVLLMGDGSLPPRSLGRGFAPAVPDRPSQEATRSGRRRELHVSKRRHSKRKVVTYRKDNREKGQPTLLACRCEAAPSCTGGRVKRKPKRSRAWGGEGRRGTTPQSRDRGMEIGGVLSAARLCGSMHEDHLCPLLRPPTRRCLLCHPHPSPHFSQLCKSSYPPRASWRECRSAPVKVDYKVHQNYLVIASPSHLPSPPTCVSPATGPGATSAPPLPLPIQTESNKDSGRVRRTGGVSESVRGTR